MGAGVRRPRGIFNIHKPLLRGSSTQSMGFAGDENLQCIPASQIGGFFMLLYTWWNKLKQVLYILYTVLTVWGSAWRGLPQGYPQPKRQRHHGSPSKEVAILTTCQVEHTIRTLKPLVSRPSKIVDWYVLQLNHQYDFCTSHSDMDLFCTGLCGPRCALSWPKPFVQRLYILPLVNQIQSITVINGSLIVSFELEWLVVEAKAITAMTS